jgi:predicted nuclease of predicted toxin-antitoxin system
VKLLLDENLSRRIVPALQEAFPGSTQVTLAGLERSDDRAVWEHAKANGYVLVTKDNDFLGLQSLSGHPPKVILVKLGNCNNDQVLNALISSQKEIRDALEQEEVGSVELY